MKFNSRELADVMAWQQPVKLNRKDSRRRDVGPSVQGAVWPTEGWLIHNSGGSSNGKEGKDKATNGRKKFQTMKQVFIVLEAVRQL